MKQTVTIFKREFSAYFNSPIAYIYIIVFLIITSGLFMSSFFLLERADMRNYFTPLPLLLSVFLPAVTMRLWAEERKLGTLSLLLSLPMKSRSLVAGKFTAALAFYLVSLLCTGVIPLILALVGNPDWGPVLTGYLGAALIGCLFLAAGMFISGLFKDQIVAFILGILVCFGMTMLGNNIVATFIDGWIGGLGQLLKEGIGASYHFSSFERGLIEWSDVFFFLSYTVIFLVLNTFTLDSKIKLHSPNRFYIATVFLLAIGFVGNLLMTDLRFGRLDLTEGHIYTVSPTTAKILSRLKAPVEVNYYVSEEEKMPSALKNIRQDVEDKLSDLARLSPHFVYHIYNPMADADKLKELAEKGIVPFQTQSIERDSLDIKRVYSAISITYLDKKTEVIPQVVPQNLGDLEYEIVSNIYRMTLDHPPKISILAPVQFADPRFNDPQMRATLLQLGQSLPQMRDNFRRAMQILQQEHYEVHRIELTKEQPLPEGTQTLIVLEPGHLNDRQIYEIQRFLAKGGNLLVAAQPYEFTYTPTAEGNLQITPRKVSSNVNQMLEPFGVQLDSKILLDRNPLVLNITMPKRIGRMFNAMVSMPVKLPIHVRVPADRLNPQVSITNRISGLLYLWGGILDIDKKSLEKNGLRETILAESGLSSWTIPFKTTPLAVDDLKPKDQEQGKSRPLAVLLEGQFPDTFEGKEIPPWPEANPPGSPNTGDQQQTEKALSIEKKRGRLIVVGCSQMFTNSAIGALDNRLFFQNMVDGLTLTEDLIGIRTKSQPIRFIKHLSAGQKLFYRFVAVGLIPVLLAALGIIRFMLRKQRRERYEKSVATG